MISAEAAPGRFTVVYKTKTFVAVTAFIRVGKQALVCTGGKSHAAGMTDQDAYAPFFARVCNSIELR